MSDLVAWSVTAKWVVNLCGRRPPFLSAPTASQNRDCRASYLRTRRGYWSAHSSAVATAFQRSDTSSDLLTWLHSAQNATARFILKSEKFDHVTSIHHHDLHCTKYQLYGVAISRWRLYSRQLSARARANVSRGVLCTSVHVSQSTVLTVYRRVQVARSDHYCGPLYTDLPSSIESFTVTNCYQLLTNP